MSFIRLFVLDASLPLPIGASDPVTQLGVSFINSSPKKSKHKMKFFDMLAARIEKSHSLLCVGLDPHGVELKEHTPEGLKAFCSRLIEATKDVACCYKPNSAFFEAIPGGVEALAEVDERISSKM